MAEEKKVGGEPEDIFAGAESVPPPQPKTDQSLAEKADTAAPPPIALEKREPAAAKPTPPPKPRKEKKPINIKKIIILAIIIIVVIAIGFAVFYGVSTFLNSKKINGTAPTTETKTETAPADEQEVLPETIDSDGDGLSDAREQELRTNINSSDTDDDGLFDKEEIDVYKTNPLQSDTDADGILDGEEIKQGTDPNDPSPSALLLDLQKEIEKLK